MSHKELTQELKAWAGELGFSMSGVCPAVAPRGARRLDEWLAAGYAGQMDYLAARREANASGRPPARVYVLRRPGQVRYLLENAELCARPGD